MNAQERLRQAIDREQDRLRAEVPEERRAAILALVRAQDRLPQPADTALSPDIVTGRRLANLGGKMALRLCLEVAGQGSGVEPEVSFEGDRALGAWRGRFLAACAGLAEAEMVLAHCETGFMWLAEGARGRFDAWIATKRTPTRWRERADVDWWASWLTRRHEAELQAVRAERPAPEATDAERVAYYRRLAAVQLKMMAYQLGYPPDAVLDHATVQTYCDVLSWLVARALEGRDRDDASTLWSERGLVAAISSALGGDPDVIRRAVAALTLDSESVGYHGAVPGVAAAPLVRLGPDEAVLSVHGLTTEPLLFLTRELRRRDAQAYHNAAYVREGVFRQELYALFQDRRFVTSSGRIELRREAGDVRTDVDAAVFDRKTGTLALFELKSQDPFARTTAELNRQRDNVLMANRQISGVLSWVQRHGADALLGRVDSRVARTFRVQKVYPFVLGRYLAHFADGPEPDRRATWATWPQLLRLLDGQPVRATDANPIASLAARLVRDVPTLQLPADGAAREIVLGDARLVVHPSYAAFQAYPLGHDRQDRV